MTRWQLYLVAAVVLFASGLGIGLSCGFHHAAKQAVQAQTQSDQHEGIALDHAASASQLHQQGNTQDTAVQTADASVQSAKRAYQTAVQRLGAARPSEHSRPLLSGNSPGFPDSSPLPGLPGLPGVIQGQSDALTKANAVIEAQDQEIAALKLQVSITKAEADQWHTAYDESQKAIALERISKDAAVRSEARRGWLHTLEGVAVGMVAGRFIK